MQKKIFRRMNKWLPGSLMMLPSLLGVGVFVLFPLGKTVCFSLTAGLENGRFVGLDNYTALMHNSAFLKALRNTAVFDLIAFPLIVLLPLLLAVLFTRHVRLSRVFEKAVYGTILLPGASLMLFVDLLFSEQGFLSREIAQILSLDSTKLYDSWFAFGLLIVLYLFRYAGFNYLIYCVALNRIPVEYYEDARISGAGTWQCFWYITLPSVTPVMLVVLLLSILNSYKIYREAFLIGGYYPHDSIYLIQHFMSNNFINMNYNRLCAVAVLIIMFTVSVFTVVWGAGKVVRRKKR